MTQVEGKKSRSSGGQGPKTKTKAKPTTKSQTPVSDDGAVQKTPKIRCFYQVLEPEQTARLKGTKFKACLQGFPDVNRLKEHLWRAHSPTHNCQYCRAKVTRTSVDFIREHEACASHAATKPRGPVPSLFTMQQATNLKKLNQHFEKPNIEEVRCKKLWDALFPGKPFEKEKYMISDSRAGVDRGGAPRDGDHTPPSSGEKGVRQSKTAAAGPRPQQQNPTPPAPPCAERPQLGVNRDVQPLFPIHTRPKEDDYPTGPHTRSHDSGIGTEQTGTDDGQQPDAGMPGSSPQRGQSNHERERRKSSGNDGIALVGSGFRLPTGQDGAMQYAKRLLEAELGDDMEEEEYAVQQHSGLEKGAMTATMGYNARSRYSESTRSQSDTDMDRGEEDDDDDEEEEEEDDYDDDDDSGGDSAVHLDTVMGDMGVDAVKHALNALYSRQFDAAVDGGEYSDFQMDTASESEC